LLFLKADGNAVFTRLSALLLLLFIWADLGAKLLLKLEKVDAKATLGFFNEFWSRNGSPLTNYS
jgi:hypothetical protein